MVRKEETVTEEKERNKDDTKGGKEIESDSKEEEVSVGDDTDDGDGANNSFDLNELHDNDLERDDDDGNSTYV